MIDLRSDTVTRPSAEMRRAMASAEVGDDVYGEDPTVRALEARVAAMLGKESAVFVPSGTMANQVALLVHTRPGDEVVIAEGAHVAWYESGAGAAIAGVQFAVATKDVVVDPASLDAAAKPPADWNPRTRLLAFENTHNRGGGRVLPHDVVVASASRARALGLAVHLDGARLANASVATGLALSALAAPADTVSLCLSKGLGAPAGSLLAGSAAHITYARRLRKMLGGAMRQAGVLAAAGLFALDHNVARLADDHRNARAFADALSDVPGLAASRPETNIVMVDLDDALPAADVFAARAKEAGLLLSPFGPKRLRAVTHLDVSLDDVTRAAAVVRDVAAALRA
ncbi:MAG: GntG family PLP-dependent aldolase [Polyangiales bacterium]